MKNESFAGHAGLPGPETDAGEIMPERETVDVFERSVGGDGCELSVVHRRANEAFSVLPPPPVAYASNDSLPEAVRAALPFVVQTLYREAYNDAWARYKMPMRSRFSVNHHTVVDRAGWAAVKVKYSRDGTTWLRRETP